MQIPTWLYAFLIGGLLLGGILFFAWQLVIFLDEIVALQIRKKFEDDVKQAMKHSQPSWEHLLEIAATRNIKNKDIYLVLQKLLREILTGRELELEPHFNILLGYLASLKEIEPFEGIPTEIRIHLERIKEKLLNETLLMQPLTNQIKELLSVNEKQRRQQRYYTTGGFFIGIVGLIFAAFSYFNPYSINSVDPDINTKKNDATPPQSSLEDLSKQ